MKVDLEPIETRVARSLQRVGYRELDVKHLGRGRITLSGGIQDDHDRNIVLAVARTVAGVQSVAGEWDEE